MILLEEACKAKNIKPEEVLDSKIYGDDRIVIVTTQGKKITFDRTESEEVAPEPEKKKPVSKRKTIR